MRSLLRKSHHLLDAMLDEFVENEVRPIAKTVDSEEAFPENTVEKLANYGLLGLPFPKSVGGAGGDEIGYALLIKKLSEACATTGVIVSAHTSLCAWPIYAYGTEKQKERYLRPLLKGEKLGAFALTEPNAGTDASMQKTTAIDKGDHYELSGSKIFITNSGYADVYIVTAITDPSAKTKGISTFIVEKGMEGFTVGKKELKLGIRGSATSELILDKVKVPKENLLGKVNKGFKIAMTTLDGGRIGIAAQAVGIARGAIEETYRYTQERKQFGRPIQAFQNTQFKLAEMETSTEAAWLLTLQAAQNKDLGFDYSKEAAMAKLNAATNAMATTTECLQLFGGYGYTREYPLERMMRDAKITEIYEGTNEAQKMVIAGHMRKERSA
ncbi:MAG: acyl-CoA dehydrogenase family protein [Candidatus Izemoplasmataceae bacterium]